MRHFALLLAVSLIAPAASTAAPATCASLLTAPEVAAAAGKGFEDMGPQDRGEGESECGWMSRGAGGFKLIAVSFWDKKSQADYEEDIAGREQATGTKREAVAGLTSAALMKNGEQLVAVVHTAGGLARVVSNGLSKAQVIAIAKAVAGPPATGAAAVAIPKTERIEGAAILAHPIGPLAVRYATALHAKGGDVAALYSRSGLAKWQAMPKSERAESDAYMKKMVPAAASLEVAIRAGGVLLVEGPKATLNLVRNESSKKADGTITASSETTAIGFELEDGAWKVAR